MTMMTITVILMAAIAILTVKCVVLELKDEKRFQTLQEQMISLSKNLAEVKAETERKDEVITDAVRQKIQEEKDQIFNEWIQNIANYNPYSFGE